MSTTNTIVAAKLANPTDDRTALADAKSSLLNSLNSDQFIVHSVRGNTVIGNKRGVMYATANGDRVDQTDEIRTLKIRLVEVEKTIADLQKGSEGFENLRHRFISTYKRDKMQEELLPHEYNWIDDGNIAAHSGNCKYDANLYFRGNRPRKDFKVYNSIYGLPPGVVITAVDDNATIHLLNTHGELSASKFKTLTPNNYLSDPLSPCSAAYWAYFNGYKEEVIDIPNE